jgi:hypothetical protein
MTAEVDNMVIAKLRAPFSCALHGTRDRDGNPTPFCRWRIADANDDAVASTSYMEEGYARLIVLALNEHFARRTK